ncbi:hypothetical protein I6E68_01650 [Salinibacterium sp. NSLL150]|uniref:hypothetical protein n=1 Tax=unclassified Salinibacterium TaxID=2632331 RepID=UPI0018CEE281|nr:MULTISPECIES: hypothetical protein [unclassified Salinibacterium]MBH0097838.1 hypothetical protein [Salinibacterium sp. NSLL35]MBH0100593.1 hypothetical protein [Salinibacterium sp. NSLL150]MBH0103352.1 hypothetical protein [Salinibacterium sp. NSLL16]MBH0106113.1 hypothetical protein [Salinibacterium sp. NSLL17]
MVPWLDTRQRLGLLGVTLVLFVFLSILGGLLPEWRLERWVFILGALIVIFTGVLPWLSVGWSRKLRRRLRVQQPDSVVFVATTTIGPDGVPEICTVAADRNCITFHRAHEVPTKRAWSTVDSLEFVQIGPHFHDCIRLLVDADEVYFVPASMGGLTDVSAFQMSVMLATLQKLRSAALNAPTANTSKEIS